MINRKLKENLVFYGSVLCMIGVAGLFASVMQNFEYSSALSTPLGFVGMTGTISGVLLIMKSLDFEDE